MRTTRWQLLWRWLATMQTVALLVTYVWLQVPTAMLQTMPSDAFGQMTYAAVAAGIMAEASVCALVLLWMLTFSLPMLTIVEVVAWWTRAKVREREEDELVRKMENTSTGVLGGL